MDIGLLEIGGFIVALSFSVLILFGARLVNTLNKTVHVTNETLELTKSTIEETNIILKNVNGITEDVSGVTKEAKKLADLLGGTVKSVEGSLSTIKNVAALIKKMKK